MGRATPSKSLKWLNHAILGNKIVDSNNCVAFTVTLLAL